MFFEVKSFEVGVSVIVRMNMIVCLLPSSVHRKESSQSTLVSLKAWLARTFGV